MTSPIVIDTSNNVVDINSATTPATNTNQPAAAGTKQPAAANQDGSRAQQNTAILQAALSVSISSQNDPLALLFKTAIDSLNKTLAPTLGDNAIQNAVNQDNTPEGTSGRIVSISTGFFAAYKKQNPGMSDADALTNFMATIRGGFEKGFKEATDILDGLKVLGGDIADNIDKTYQLVIKGYADFEASFATPATPATGTTGTQPGSPDASIPLSATTTANDA